MDNHSRHKAPDHGLRIFPSVSLEEQEPATIDEEPGSLFPRLFIEPPDTEKPSDT